MIFERIPSCLLKFLIFSARLPLHATTQEKDVCDYLSSMLF